MNKDYKPVLNVNGLDGNIFAVMGAATRVLRSVDKVSEAKEMSDKVWATKSYSEALAVISEYVEFVDREDEATEGYALCYGCGGEYPKEDLEEGYCPDCYASYCEGDEEQ